MSRLTTLDFDIWHEDGLLFEESPELFVRLESVPVIFTVRGIGYFRPRFKHVGVDLRDIKTGVQFGDVHGRWLQVEFELMRQKISAAAAATQAPNQHQVLEAILRGDIEAAEAAMARLEHRTRASLRLV